MKSLPTPTERRQPLLRRVTHVLLTLAMALGLAAVATLATPSPAHALCVTPKMEGTWNNIDPATRSIAQVEIEFVCGDVRLCDIETGVCSGGQTFYRIRPWGKCTPTNCDWGQKPMTAVSDGWHRTTYTHSWATKTVWARTEEWHGRTYLRVWHFTDFTVADGRTDFESNNYFLP